MALAAALASPLGPHSLLAQGSGTIAGVVRDVDGMPIEGVTVTIDGTRARAFTDAEGSFRLSRVAAGRSLVQLRRIGFRPTETSVALEAGGTSALELTLERIVPVLEAVHVEGSRRSGTGRLTGFYERRARGHGHFITREDIDKRNPFRTTDLFRTIPGIRLTPVAPSRSMLNMRSAQCPPLIYLDGAPAAAAYFDPDVIPPLAIEAIEVYSGPATVPPEFHHSRWQAGCGVIAIWSRIELPPPRRRAAAENARELARLIQGNRIFTADQVDAVAIVADSAGAQPSYPERLLFEGVGGTVVAEFVVDTLGRVEQETMGVVSATHREFANAVMSALVRTLFRPAMKDGQRVRQLVQQPFTFAPRTGPPHASTP